MKVKLVSHASIIVYTKLGGIWCDPWLRGKAFNNSWTMRPEPQFDPAWCKDIAYIWISHEHPDHFSVPTLRGLDDAFKKRVMVLFQKRNSDKLFKAMRDWGFLNFLDLPNRQTLLLGQGVTINCMQVGLIDSALSVSDNTHSIINLNDADLSAPDHEYVKSVTPKPRLVVNQFSIAGYDGYIDREATLQRQARLKIENMLSDHRQLEAECTMPFASFVYFSAVDNRFMNQYSNSIGTVQRAFDAAGLKTAVLYSGDEYQPGDAWDNTPALEKYQRLHDTIDQASYDVPPLIPVDQLRQAFQTFCRTIAERYPALLIKRVGVVKFYLEDHRLMVVGDFVARTLTESQESRDQADIEVYSQPLHFGFSVSFGFETLAVSGRFRVLHNRSRWRMLKILSILNNQEVYLRLPYVLDRKTLGYLYGRFRANLFRQFLHRKKLRYRMKPDTA